MLIGGIIAAAATARSKGNPYYAATFLWALLGIFMAGGQVATIIAASCILAALFVILVTLLKLRIPKYRRRWFG